MDLLLYGKIKLTKEKRNAPSDQLQPSFLHANRSSNVRTPQNRNLQKSVDFATNQNSTLTPQQGESIPMEQSNLQQQVVNL